MSEDTDYYSFYDEFDPREDCDHSEYEVDFEGRAVCICGRRWWLTPEQFERHLRMEADWMADYDREMRRERFFLWRCWRWLQGWVRHRRALRDDEIPF